MHNTKYKFEPVKPSTQEYISIFFLFGFKDTIEYKKDFTKTS